jgi:acylphosphatase
VRTRAHIIVNGDVQGVFFRQETKQRAEAHDVRGWIRNRNDGTVEAVFEGEEQDVKALIDFSKRGPSRAAVTNVDVKLEAYTGEYKGFKIRYT